MEDSIRFGMTTDQLLASEGVTIIARPPSSVQKLADSIVLIGVIEHISAQYDSDSFGPGPLAAPPDNVTLKRSLERHKKTKGKTIIIKDVLQQLPIGETRCDGICEYMLWVGLGSS